MVRRVCAVTVPEPCVLPNAGVGMGASVYADIAAKDFVIVVDDSVDSSTAWQTLLSCKSKCGLTLLFQGLDC